LLEANSISSIKALPVQPSAVAASPAIPTKKGDNNASFQGKIGGAFL